MKKPINLKRRANEIDKHIGERVRAARNAAGLSQEKLGERLGITFQQIQKYEKGVNRVSCGAIVLIAAALDTTVQWFFDDAPGLAKGSGTVAGMSRFFSTDGAAKLATDFVRLPPAHRAAVRSLASSL